MMPKCKWRLDPGQIEVVDEAVAEVLRRRTPAQRVAMISAADRTMRLLLEAHMRSMNPNWNKRQIRREIARRMSRATN